MEWLNKHATTLILLTIILAFGILILIDHYAQPSQSDSDTITKRLQHKVDSSLSVLAKLEKQAFIQNKNRQIDSVKFDAKLSALNYQLKQLSNEAKQRKEDYDKDVRETEEFMDKELNQLEQEREEIFND